MKVSKIEIKDFHQFKDLTIDLTYPKGHEKEGQPLSKVCFIGQSGTGKTSLLELMPKFLFNYNSQFITKSGEASIYDNIKVKIIFGFDNEYTTEISFAQEESVGSDNKTLTRWTWDEAKNLYKDQEDFVDIYKFYSMEWINKVATKLIYFPANLNYEIEIGNEIILLDKKIIDFSTQKVSLAWNLILGKIQKYQEQELQIITDTMHLLVLTPVMIIVIKKLLLIQINQKVVKYKKPIQ